MRTAWTMVVLALGAPAQAQRLAEAGDGALRGSVVRTIDGQALGGYICGDLGVGLGFFLVGCGASADLFGFDAVGGQLSHYRVERQWRLVEGGLQLDTFVGLGMAEGQVGQDTPGFYLASAGLDTIEAAGGELTWSVDLVLPQLFWFARMRMRADAGVAWLPGWRAAGGTSDDVVPFGVLTANGEF